MTAQINQIVDYLIKLINIDTTVGSNNEIEAAKYIQDVFNSYGIASKIYEPRSGRGSIFSMIKGKGKENIILYSHLDTAPYDGDGWLFPPSKATLQNNCIVGRGALDCKGLTAIWMKIFIDIHLKNIIPNKNIIFLACADEETGGKFGLEWLLNNTNILDDTALVISEGGGYPVALKDKYYYTLQTGEILPNIESSISSYTQDQIEKIFSNAIDMGYYNENTLEFYSNLKLQGKRKIPKKYFYEKLESLLSNKIKWDNKKYFDIIEKNLKLIDTKYELLPLVTPGYSDNRFFRERNIPTLGFFPLDIKNNISGIHRSNEYISFKSLDLAYDILSRTVSSLIH